MSGMKEMLREFVLFVEPVTTVIIPEGGVVTIRIPKTEFTTKGDGKTSFFELVEKVLTRESSWVQHKTGLGVATALSRMVFNEQSWTATFRVVN